jgi:hypothetical protein
MQVELFEKGVGEDVFGHEALSGSADRKVRFVIFATRD